MAIVYFAGNKIVGLSTDTKPMAVADGATFYETDSKTIYVKVLGSWQIISSACGYIYNRVDKTGAYTATANDDEIRCLSGTWTLSLPAATSTGKVYYIKNKGKGKITVSANGTDKIDGGATQQILAGGALQIVDAAIGEWDVL